MTASPRSRGWTPESPPRCDDPDGFPALAGMDPPPAPSRTTSWRLPRARGDGPRLNSEAVATIMASPRSRGWTLHLQSAALDLRGFPALAGMDPVSTGGAPAGARLPRARGDGPNQARWRHYWIVASPRSRGWTRDTHYSGCLGVGFPALAGMDPARPGGRYAAAWLPRARGDGPCPSQPYSSSRVASPRSRGWTLPHGSGATVLTGFPALAGMDRPDASGSRGRRRLPRARGDGPWGWRQMSRRGMASPRSRGWTRLAPGARGRARGFPALAGMDLRPAQVDRKVRGLPRARGDGPCMAST